MYSKEPRLVKFYKNINAVHTEKVFYGFLSERHKISENEFEYDSWSARFIGKAREKAEELKDGMLIELESWNCRNRYDKESKKNTAYILIYDFDKY